MMREWITKFMTECPGAKVQPFANNSFGVYVRNDIPEAIYTTGLVDKAKYLITASVGAGNWAMIPWVCIFDRSITTTATKGVYIVYLLSKDSKRLYLTFNQGCTEISNTHGKRETIQIMREKAAEIVAYTDAYGFSVGDNIDLGDNLTSLGQYYERGTIYYKMYDVNAIPGEDVLRQDLDDMMRIYQQYAQHQNGDDGRETYSRIGVFDSWTIVDEHTAIKRCDKSFFDHNGSGVPREICWFFEADDMEPGEVRPWEINYQDKVYEIKIRKESAEGRRVQISWNVELGKQLAKYRALNTTATFIRAGDHVHDLIMKGDEAEMTIQEKMATIRAYIESKGFTYSDSLIENFYLSLKSKPFVILAGTSGTGKTRLVRLFAEAIGATKENGRYEQVAVRPDWSDSTDLFGHVDLNGKFIPGKILEFLWKAQQNKGKPYILCLDEMNLARVEYYLSDFLSVIETRDMKNGEIITDPLVSEGDYGSDNEARQKYGEIRFPENLYIVGTVNMDETTFPFSKKVLDRANTIEFNYVNLNTTWSDAVLEVEPLDEDNSFLKSEYLKLRDCQDKDYVTIEGFNTQLERYNQILQKANAHVGYRVRDEIVFYLLNNLKTGVISEDEAMDNEIIQKILPRIQGSSASVKSMLCDLFKEIAGDYEGYQTESNNTADRMLDMLRKNEHVKYPKSAEKIAFMVRRFEEDGFTSYWL